MRVAEGSAEVWWFPALGSDETRAPVSAVIRALVEQQGYATLAGADGIGCQSPSVFIAAGEKLDRSVHALGVENLVALRFSATVLDLRGTNEHYWMCHGDRGAVLRTLHELERWVKTLVEQG